MKPELWARIQELFLAALELAPDERKDFVARRARGEAELRREVERLLEHHNEDPQWLEEPVVRPDDLAGAEPEEAYVGPYRVVRKIGEGGMGSVFLAVREEPDFRLPVALKVIRRGMDTEDVLRRFRLEQQILASLNHPNIATVIDAGTTEDERPYFAMEFISGTRIDRYCEERHAPLEERLELFEHICAAVQHAHQNLVVHRDIKPSNVLVTAEGVPKLLDFGIGKVLLPSAADTEVPRTRTGVRLLTPEYSAPEQVRGEAVTTATDVYGLGVLLYRLVTGRHPYLEGDESPVEIERCILEAEPPKPSTVAMVPPATAGSSRPATSQSRLRRQLAGDLDTIVLEALKKEPERRYPSAANLLADLRRFREGRPISARPDTIGYRAVKFVRRNAWAVTAAAAVVVGLAATTLVTVAQSARVATERDAAIQERDKALEVRGFLMEMFGATGDAATDSITARELLDLQAEALETAYGDRPVLRAEMMEVLADGYERLGLFEDAESFARDAVALRREHLPARHPDIASSLNTLGWILFRRGGSVDAVPLLEEAVSIRREAGPSQEIQLSRSLNDLGVVVQQLDDLVRAEPLFVEALDIRMRGLGESHRAVGVTANNLGGVRFGQGDYVRAAAAFERSLSSLRRAVGPDHVRSRTAETNLAVTRELAGDRLGATEVYRDLRERALRLFGPAHPNVTHPTAELVGNLIAIGRPEEARDLARETLLALRDAGEDSSPPTAMMYTQLGDAEKALGEYAASQRSFSESIRIYRGLYGPSHSSLVAPLTKLGVAQRQLGDLAGALESVREATEVATGSLRADHLMSLSAFDQLGVTLLDSGEAEEALRAFDLVAERALPRAPDLPAVRDFHDHGRAGVAAARIAIGDERGGDSILHALRAAGDSGLVAESTLSWVTELTLRLDSVRGF